MVNTHLSSAVCLHAGLWKSMASHFWWIEPLVRALSHRKYLRFFSLYNPKRCRFQLCRRPTSAKGKWPAVKMGSQFKHSCQLMSGVTHSSSVHRGVTKTLSPLAFGRCLDLPGLLCQVDQVEFLMWAGTVKEGLSGYRKERNPNRQSILKDEKESVGNKNWKMRLEKMKTRKWTEMLWKVDREEGEKWCVWNVQYTPHEKLQTRDLEVGKGKKSENFCLSFDWQETSSSVSFEYCRVQTLFLNICHG